MTDKPANPAATPDAADPSMEEILASIRRILNEDEVPAAPPADGEAPTGDDVLILDAAMLVPADKPKPGVVEVEPESEPVRPEAEAPRQAMEAVTSPPQVDPFEQDAPADDLIAPETAAAAAFSIGSLVRTLAAGRSTQVYAGGPTLEDMVRAELRPLLKQWLDANLPPVVERLVRAEIEKVVGRAIS
jgi:cell pole-organizing protein PopZ